MKSLLIRNLLKPILSRLGTAAAALLVAKGFDGELIQQLIVALSGAALVAADLFVARVTREVA